MLGRHLKLCEDSHTASVFTHLLHLPAESFWAILRRACFTEQLPRNPGELLSVHPWPRWGAGDIPGKTTIIPDLFIRFTDFDLIIEAKRGDRDQQDPEQWRREFIAYLNDYCEEEKPVKMIALGGLLGTEDRSVTRRSVDPTDAKRQNERSCPVHMCRWQTLLQQCQRMRHEWQRLEYPTSQTAAAVRLLTDLIDLFACHGYSTGRWFADLEFARYRLVPSVDAHLRVFAARSRKLNPQ